MSKEVINNITLSKDTGDNDLFTGSVDVFGKKSAEDTIIENSRIKDKAAEPLPKEGGVDVFLKDKPTVIEPSEDITDSTLEEDIVPTKVEDGNPPAEEEVSDVTQVEEELIQGAAAPEADEEIVQNVFYHLGHELKSNGVMPEDFNITEDITGKDIYSAYYNKLHEGVVNEIHTEYINKLKSDYSEDALEYAKLLTSGVNPQMLYEANQIGALAGLDIENSDAEAKLNVIKAYYKDRNFKDQEISQFVNSIENEALDINSIAEEAKSHFKTKHTTILAREAEAAEQRDLQVAQAAQERRANILSLIDKGEAGGVPILNKEEVRKAALEASQIVTIQGTDYQVSEMDLFNLDIQNSTETYMAAFLRWKYGDKLAEGIKEEAKKEAEEDLLKGYRKSVEKSTKKLIRDQRTTKIKAQPNGKKALILNSSGVPI